MPSSVASEADADAPPPSVTVPEASSTAAGDKEPKKIKRIQLSCTSCRHRKLKCDRLSPCQACIRRGQAQSCFYANPGPRKTPAHARLSARNNELQQRLMHLEELVVSLSNQNDGSPDAAIAAIQARKPSPDSRTGLADDESDSPGRMVTDSIGTRYVDASHWRAMLDEIASVKEYLEEGDDEADDPGHENDPAFYAATSIEQGAPHLMRAIPAGGKGELLSGIPSRTVVDQLVTRWFNGKEPSLICIHIPTFMKEYDRFWKEPRQMPIAFVSMLYAIIWLGTNFYIRTGEAPPTDVPADPAELLDFYLNRCVQAILQMDYTKPGKYKVEALMLYFGAEYLRYRDAQSGLAFIAAIINRLAMLSGYHRDPKHFPHLTPFEGEMRRRSWALIRQFETLIAFQVGLPRLNSDWQSDTEPPSNLHYEDIDEDMEEMPQSRPESERTPVSYQIAKGRLMEVFGQISDKTFSRERTSYDEVMILDMRAREAYDALPHFLKIKPLNLCLTDPAELVMQRYNLQFLFQKARCVLHRRYFTSSAVDPRSVYSKKICVESALEILKHQKDLYEATMPGGLLRHDAWYISSLTTHDFIMACMILCLWLCRETTQQQPEAARIRLDSRELFRALEGSYSIWTQLKDKSYEAYKAADALALMLRKTRARRPSVDMSTTSSAGGDTSATNPAEQLDWGAGGNSSEFSVGSVGTSNSHSTPGTNRSLQDTSMANNNFGNFDENAFGAVSDSLLNPDLTLDMDWNSWDLQYMGGTVEVDAGNMGFLNEADLSNFPDLNIGQQGSNGNVGI